jgi:hypothetical protein
MKEMVIFGATTFSIMTLSITTFSIKTLSMNGLFATLSIMTFSINDTLHNNTLRAIMLNVSFYFFVMLSVVMLNFVAPIFFLKTLTNIPQS